MLNCNFLQKLILINCIAFSQINALPYEGSTTDTLTTQTTDSQQDLITENQASNESISNSPQKESVITSKKTSRVPATRAKINNNTSTSALILPQEKIIITLKKFAKTQKERHRTRIDL